MEAVKSCFLALVLRSGLPTLELPGPLALPFLVVNLSTCGPVCLVCVSAQFCGCLMKAEYMCLWACFSVFVFWLVCFMAVYVCIRVCADQCVCVCVCLYV